MQILWIYRFDDTNPVKEKMEYEKSIIEDLRLLDINTDKVTHTSDYFERTQEFCERLLSKGAKIMVNYIKIVPHFLIEINLRSIYSTTNDGLLK